MLRKSTIKSIHLNGVRCTSTFILYAILMKAFMVIESECKIFYQ